MAEPDRPPEKAASKITVLISGNGTNLQALIDASNTHALPNAQIVRVISDRKNAYGLQRAQNAGIPTTYHGILPYKKEYPSDPANPAADLARSAYDKDLAGLVLADEPDIVACAGFMRIVTTAFLDPLNAANISIINLHPSLHGDLVGADCMQRAFLEYQQGTRTQTGVMVHYVIAEVDMGRPIVQQAIEMEGCVELEDLRVRVQACEHGLIVTGTRTALEEKMGKS